MIKIIVTKLTTGSRVLSVYRNDQFLGSHTYETYERPDELDFQEDAKKLIAEIE